MSRSRPTLVALSVIGAAMMVATRPDPVQAQHRGNVEICHHAGPTKTITLHVSPSGAAAHLANHDGDSLGNCDSGTPT